MLTNAEASLLLSHVHRLPGTPLDAAILRAQVVLKRNPGRVYVDDVAPCGCCPAFSSRLIGPDRRDVRGVRWIDEETREFGIVGDAKPHPLDGHYCITSKGHVWADLRATRAAST